MAAGCVPAVVQLLGSSSNVGVLVNAALCLALLASRDSECGLAAIDAGGRAALRRAQSRAIPAIKEHVGNAVRSLELCLAAAKAAAKPQQPPPQSAASSGPSECATAASSASAPTGVPTAAPAGKQAEDV
ncbi:hypothetical protein ABPG77_010345 [Micractinium sp. CCAP 211/92]